jgi:HEPN domain-containing protein
VERSSKIGLVVSLSITLYREMIERAKHLYRISVNDIAAGRYEIALFHLEQAVQLSLKAYLLKTIGDFPRTHSIKGLVELTEDNCLMRLSEEKWYVIDILEDAYTGARYFLRTYGEREYVEAKNFVEGVFKCIGISIT